LPEMVTTSRGRCPVGKRQPIDILLAFWKYANDRRYRSIAGESFIPNANVAETARTVRRLYGAI
jgi:hypothetical protein